MSYPSNKAPGDDIFVFDGIDPDSIPPCLVYPTDQYTGELGQHCHDARPNLRVDKEILAMQDGDEDMDA